MRFKPGMLGVAAVTLALVGMLLGSWVMSMDVTEEEVTKYNALTEIGGLFESEKTPTFTEYNPSTNYTGYYTSDSIVGTDRFFDGVEFSESTSPNNFRVQKMPTSSVVDDDYDLLDLTPTGYKMVRYFETNTLQSNENRTYAKYMSIADLVTELGYTGGNVKLTITSTQEPSDYTVFEDYIVFFTSEMEVAPNAGVWMKNPSLTGTLIYYSGGVGMAMDASRVSNPILGAVWDGISVNLFYDVECTKSAGTVNADSVFIAWGGGPVIIPDGTVEQFDSVADLEYLVLPNPQYMDPSKGVVME